MTCASCVRRVEKALNKVAGRQRGERQPGDREGDGRLRSRPWPSSTQLSAAVEKAGYSVGALPAPRRRAAGGPLADTPHEPRSTRTSSSGQREIDDLRRKWQVSLAVGLAMMALMYLPLGVADATLIAPVLLIAATVVQFWAGARVLRGRLGGGQARRAPT